MAKQCLPCLFLLQVWLRLAVSHSIVKFLPGFEGPLPFHLETGYVGVDEAEDVQLFYYFIKSQGNPKEDPLLLWQAGGPVCSSFSGLAFEIGPISFEEKEYNGSLPTLVLNPYSWTQVSNILFVDMLAGTGFSYARDPLAFQRSDLKHVSQTDQFLRKWLMDHQEFLSNPVYIAGDSYSGLTVPPAVQKISNGNDEGMKPLINIKGYILGNPLTDFSFDGSSRVPFVHGMGLISDELYESLKKSCGGEYRTINPSNVECLKNVEAVDKCISGIQIEHIFDRQCPPVPQRPINKLRKRRYLNENSQELLHLDPNLPTIGCRCISGIQIEHLLDRQCPVPQCPIDMLGKRRYLNENSQELLHFEPNLPTIGCRSYNQLLATYWANDDDVRQALHVREGSIGKWQRCNFNYTLEFQSSIKYHIDLGIIGYRRLIYSGDHDMGIPFTGTQAWIRSLNYSIVDDWHPWHSQAQVAGYTRTYSNQLTFATVMGGGHTAPEYKPAECFAMFKRWIIQEPL